jgi:ACS family hexuronate transporter-like MFS transporter
VVRWGIAALLALATALSYLDRQSFPLVAGEIRREIPMDDAEYARLGTLFLVAYGLMYAVGGKLLDALGTRLGYTVMIAFWSIANAMTGLATSTAQLGLFRFLLGAGEGGGFPASGKAVAEWFPARERSFAFGLFNTGSALGAVVAAPALAAIAAFLGWRWVFFLTGGLGLAWAAVWILLYRKPRESPWLGTDERAYLEANLVPETAGPRLRWADLFRYRQVWGLMAAKLLTDSVWFFLIFFLPRYLSTERGFDLKAIGSVAWIPFAAAGLGSFLGGWLGARLIRRGATIDRARKTALLLAAAIMPAAAFIVPSPTWGAVALFSACLFAHQFWSANVQTLAADLFPSRVVGSVEGLLGSAGALGAGLAQWKVGDLIAVQGYALPFAFCGFLHLCAFALIAAVVGRIEPVSSRNPEGG